MKNYVRYPLGSQDMRMVMRCKDVLDEVSKLLL